LFCRLFDVWLAASLYLSLVPTRRASDLLRVHVGGGHRVEAEHVRVAAVVEFVRRRRPHVGQRGGVVALHPLRHGRRAPRRARAARLAHLLVVTRQRDRLPDPDARHIVQQPDSVEARRPSARHALGVSLHCQSPLISRHDARSKRGASVCVPRTSDPPEPPTTNRPRSRFGRVGIPPPTFTEPTGRGGTPVSSCVLPSPSRLKYEPPALVPVKASSALM